MNKAKLKNYAPQARRDFIQMIRRRADLLGLTKKDDEQPFVYGDVAIIKGRNYPKRYAELHKKLAGKIKSEGFEQFVERIAYSWFNRFAALRFMEVNNLLSHGFRVLSNREPGKNEPEILTHATDIDLPGLDKNKIMELKLAANKDAELYRLLLIAQCNELHRSMPFLFEKINDETEFLLPDNLLHSDSVIRKMAAAIDEEDWAEVEIIGWLYQFYISEKKDEVIGRTVKSEDIPAATQLFTPNWIVKYMTQNSLGRLWLENNPHSALAQNMEFYIKPAEENQSPIPNPKAQINPEELRILDPACGSGHILVEAYELLKAIYTERGYSSRDIPLLILEKNLFGLDIDECASQMASFALLMKARRDDRRIFEKIREKGSEEKQLTPYPLPLIPNILTIPDSSQLECKTEEIAGILAAPSSDAEMVGKVEAYSPSTLHNAIIRLLEAFSQGKTLGSLIRIPEDIGLTEMNILVDERREHGNLIEQAAAKAFEPFVRAAKMLANKYDSVIANPPYMGGKGMNAELKAFAKKQFPDSKSDLFAMFIERSIELTKNGGFLGFMTPYVWMFLSSYEKLREIIADKAPIVNLVKPSYTAYFESAIVAINSFVLKKGAANYHGDYFDLGYLGSAESQPIRFKEAVNDSNTTLRFHASTEDFKKIPGSPVAYWVSNKLREVFEKGTPLGEIAEPRQGMATTDNNRFLRFWHEIGINKFALYCKSLEEASKSQMKWFPYNKGGEFRKWYGNNDYVVNYENNGEALKKVVKEKYREKDYAQGFSDERWDKLIEIWVLKNQQFYFQPSITWSFVSSSFFGVRRSDSGFIFDVGGSSAFPKDDLRNVFTGFLCTNIAFDSMKALNPTLNFQVENVKTLPILENEVERIKPQVDEIVEECVAIARADWDSFETSWDFESLPLLRRKTENGKWIIKTDSVEQAWNDWKELTERRIMRMQQLETENNRLFIQAYGLEDELSPEVPSEQITLARADAEKDVRRLLSYFIGCLMGRYSLDETGLIYADAGNKGFNPARYLSFPADDNGIVPVTDIEWFAQEAASRFAHFVRVAFSMDNGKRIMDNEEELSIIRYQLSINLRWIAERLGAKTNETPIETIRRYFSTSFFKDHLQTYKKRPIYWLFSSGKQKAFECLVYLHRYSESTLPRMRHEYVLPLMRKLTAQIETLENLTEKAETTAVRNKLQKQLEVFRKKQAELAGFDEKLRHYSDLRITLDLDDGVRVNYGKFGDLLAEVKQVAKTE